MRKASMALLTMALALAVTRGAGAQCTLPHTLTNGAPADATQVMANYNALVTCLGNRGTVNAGTIGQIGIYAATGSAISGLGVSALLDQNFSSARGTILYRGVGGWAALAPGTSGFVLQSGGAGADPSWVSSGGGGGGGVTTIVAGGVSAGTSTVGLAPGPVISRPASGAFTWLNQGSATVTDNANGPLVLRTTQNTGLPSSINALNKAVPGASWTVTINYALGNHSAANGVDLAGLIVYNSVNGRLFISGIRDNNAVAIWQYNSTTSWNAQPAVKSILFNPQSVWIRAQYVAGTTTLTFSYSIDGVTWEVVYATNAPFVGVPTHYGIAVGTGGNAAGYIVSLNYMLESSP